MYDPDIPGVGWRMHYDRLERVYDRLQSGNRSSVDYGDDLQHFFQDCLHLADWIGGDKTTGISVKEIRDEMNRETPLQDAGNLANASKHFRRREGEDKTYVISGDVKVFPGQDRPAEISHVVAREDGATLSAQDLVRDAFAAWRSILHRHGLL